MSVIGPPLALDSSVVIDLLKAKRRDMACLDGFSGIFLPVPVIAELRFGVAYSPRFRNDLHRLDQFVARCSILEMDLGTATQYADLKCKLSSVGRSIPINDLWIAATCLQHGMTLATEDKHFELVEGLQLVSYR